MDREVCAISAIVVNDLAIAVSHISFHANGNPCGTLVEASLEEPHGPGPGNEISSYGQKSTVTRQETAYGSVISISRPWISH